MMKWLAVWGIESRILPIIANLPPLPVWGPLKLNTDFVSLVQSLSSGTWIQWGTCDFLTQAFLFTQKQNLFSRHRVGFKACYN